VYLREGVQRDTLHFGYLQHGKGDAMMHDPTTSPHLHADRQARHAGRGEDAVGFDFGRKEALTFDAGKHEYRIDGSPVPSVTQVLRDVLPGRDADDYYLSLGSCAHARYAMLARGEEFEPDPQFDGYVAAWNKWAESVNLQPWSVEKVMGSSRLMIGGTLDLVGLINGKATILDYKGTADARAEWQLAFYSILYAEDTKTKPIDIGVALELHSDGSAPKQLTWNLKRARAECMGLLTAFNIRKRLGLTSKADVR
jgi:hypothetical protein